MVKNRPADAGDIREEGSIPGLGRSPGGEHATHSSILAWRIPWTEDPSRLQSVESQRVGHNSTTNTFTLRFDHSCCGGGLRQNKTPELRAQKADGCGPYIQPLKEKSIKKKRERKV